MSVIVVGIRWQFRYRCKRKAKQYVNYVNHVRFGCRHHHGRHGWWHCGRCGRFLHHRQGGEMDSQVMRSKLCGRVWIASGHFQAIGNSMFKLLILIFCLVLCFTRSSLAQVPGHTIVDGGVIKVTNTVSVNIVNTNVVPVSLDSRQISYIIFTCGFLVSITIWNSFRKWKQTLSLSVWVSFFLWSWRFGLFGHRNWLRIVFVRCSAQLCFVISLPPIPLTLDI